MKTIVKYGNRKLYDKETAKYTSVTEIANLPLGSFKVEDHSTGEDLTTDTLLSALTHQNVESEIKVNVMKYCITELQEGTVN